MEDIIHICHLTDLTDSMIKVPFKMKQYAYNKMSSTDIVERVRNNNTESETERWGGKEEDIYFSELGLHAEIHTRNKQFDMLQPNV